MKEFRMLITCLCLIEEITTRNRMQDVFLLFILFKFLIRILEYLDHITSFLSEPLLREKQYTSTACRTISPV
jgi:hypothetical protein